jgi:outer membrane receptor protein involved in Fe transport
LTSTPWGRVKLKPGRIALSGFWLLAGIAGQFSARADDQLLEEVLVTGTRLARPDFDSASPIVTVTADVFERTGSATTETTLNRYPQFVPTKTGTSNGFSDGESNLNLRGLGPNRTLTLVQGRRLTPVNGDGEVDVNVIPPALIERAEILTGGASAVYGSDAVAGVVNLPLRREFDGAQLAASGVQTDHGDGQEYDVSLTAGTRFAEGRGSVMGYVAYYDRAQVNQTARSFAPANLLYVGPGNGIAGPGRAYVGVGSGIIEEGIATIDEENLYDSEVFWRLFARYGYPSGTVPQRGNAIGFNTDGTVFTTGNFSPDSVANFRGQGDPVTSNSFTHQYNFAPYVALQMPLTRTSAYTAVNFDLNENLELYADGIYADYTVNSQFAPVPLFDVRMPPTNPFIPQDFRRLLDSRPDPDAPFDFWKRVTVLGPRVIENNYDMHQLAVGVRGRLPGDWVVDAYAQYGASSQWKYLTGNISRSKVEELTFAPDGGVAICGGFDIFGLDSVEPGCAAYVGVNAGISADVRQAIAEVWARGVPLALPAGELRMALGVQYRKEEYEYRADDALRKVLPDGGADISGIALGENIDAEDHNIDMYVEAAIPLLADLPGVQSLETVLGLRRSDYASAGHTETWKAELLYQPVTALRLRGSYQRAVRVPSMNELFQPTTSDIRVFVPGEPCSVNSLERDGPDRQQVEALCIQQGVPAQALPDFFSDRIPTTVSGNPDLAPEVGETLTAGVIVRPGFEQPWLRELQFTIDWYQIEIENSVEYVDAVTAVANCFDRRYNANYAATNYWCTLFGRDPDGNLINGIDTFRNLAITATSGVDFQLGWQIPAGPGGLQVGWYVSWLAEDEFQPNRDSPTERSVGTIGGFGGARPEWKSLMDLRYAWGKLELGAAWQYIASTRDTSRTRFKTEDHVVPNQDYFNLDASYTFDDGWFNGSTVHVGVVNLTDELPPVFPEWVAYNTDPSQYDVLGRRYFVSLALRF